MNRRWCEPELGKEDRWGTREDPGLEFSQVHQEALKGAGMILRGSHLPSLIGGTGRMGRQEVVVARCWWQ